MWKCDVFICVIGCNEFWKYLGRGTRNHCSSQEGSSLGKIISMLISRDTSMTGNSLEV